MVEEEDVRRKKTRKRRRRSRRQRCISRWAVCCTGLVASMRNWTSLVSNPREKIYIIYWTEPLGSGWSMYGMVVTDGDFNPWFLHD